LRQQSHRSKRRLDDLNIERSQRRHSCTAPDFSDTRQHYAASWAVIVAANVRMKRSGTPLVSGSRTKAKLGAMPGSAGHEGAAVVVAQQHPPRGIGADGAEDPADGQRQRLGGSITVAAPGDVPAETFGVPVLGDDEQGDVTILDRSGAADPDAVDYPQPGPDLAVPFAGPRRALMQGAPSKACPAGSWRRCGSWRSGGRGLAGIDAGRRERDDDPKEREMVF
jgi:hypothetical protein